MFDELVDRYFELSGRGDLTEAEDAERRALKQHPAVFARVYGSRRLPAAVAPQVHVSELPDVFAKAHLAVADHLRRVGGK